MSPPDRPKKIGRPEKPEAERRRHNHTVRVREATRVALQTKAKQNQRSVSEEIESIIERSLYEEEKLETVFGGPEEYYLFVVMAQAIRRIKARRDYPSLSEEDVREAIRGALTAIINSHFWTGRPNQPWFIPVHGDGLPRPRPSPDEIGHEEAQIAMSQGRHDRDTELEAIEGRIEPRWSYAAMQGAPALGTSKQATHAVFSKEEADLSRGDFVEGADRID